MLVADKTARPAAKPRGRPFVAGKSGNPAGRPKGRRNQITVICEQLLGDDAEAVVKKAIAMAKKGEPAMLRLVVERLVPARSARDRTVELDIPLVARAADIVTAAAAVIDGATKGQYTLSEARELMSLLEGQRKMIETADLAVRVELLEGQLVASDAAAAASPAALDIAARVRRLDV